MTLKELRLDLKAKTNAFENDPHNEKAKAAYLAAKKALDQANKAIIDSVAENFIEDNKKAATNPKKAAAEAKKAAEDAAIEAGIAAIAAKAAADKAEVAAEKAAQEAKTTEPVSGAVTEKPNADQDDTKKN